MLKAIVSHEPDEGILYLNYQSEQGVLVRSNPLAANYRKTKVLYDDLRRLNEQGVLTNYNHAIYTIEYLTVDCEATEKLLKKETKPHWLDRFIFWITDRLVRIL